MNKTLLVAEFEFMQTAKRWQFLAITFFLPLFVATIFFLSYKSGTFAMSRLSKQFKEGKQLLIEDRSNYLNLKSNQKFKVVEDLLAHKQDLISEKAIGYIKVPENYMESGKMDLVVLKSKALGASKTFEGPTRQFARQHLLQGIDSESHRKRIYNTLSFNLHTIDGQGEVKPYDYHQLVIPFLFLMIFILSVSTASTFLLQSVSEEKENRTIEILLSTVNDQQLIGGKVIGLGAAALLQVFIWILMALGSFQMVASKLAIPLQLELVPASHIIHGTVTLLIGFMLFAAIMVGVGALAPNYKDAQQYSSIFLIGSILPVYVMQIIVSDIHGKLAIFLYYFPLTSPLVMVTRYCLGGLSLAETMAGFGVLFLCALLSVWMASKMFRLGCLMYNRKPSILEIKTALIG